MSAEEQAEIDESWSSFFYSGAVPINQANNSWFRKAVRKTRSTVRRVLDDDLRGPLLEKAMVKYVQPVLNEAVGQSKEFGVTCQC